MNLFRLRQVPEKLTACIENARRRIKVAFLDLFPLLDHDFATLDV